MDLVENDKFLSKLVVFWGGIWDSNPRPSEPQSDALANCANSTIYAESLYRLSVGVPWGIRTSDLLLRRQLLYPAELRARIGAGDGNRTHAASLEGWNSTIEQHPRI